MGKVNVSHLLVEHRHEAEDLERKLQEGAHFEDLARRYSRCASASAGGLLGLVDESRLDPDFREALDLLRPGQISKPVRTRFGYHLIRRESADSST